MGGLAVACGLLSALIAWSLCFPADVFAFSSLLPLGGFGIAVGIALILSVGLIDDLRGLGPTTKLCAQAISAMCLFADGVAIEKIFVFGWSVDLGFLSPFATVLWFLVCMNVWNLIDGMDGLASGNGLIVAVTLMIGSALMSNFEISFAAAALAGSLAGFLLYNFHPAKIFLGDTGSLLLGTVLGILAIKGSLKSGMTAAMLIPILAMGLPIVDTLLAIVRRWMRYLPWNTADHGHLHHRLLAFGLSTRQASFFLYSFTLLLCAASLTSVVWQSDSFACVFALLAVAGLYAVFLARHEDAQKCLMDFRHRLAYRKTEQRAAKLVWEAIQRLPSISEFEQVEQLLEKVSRQLQCAHVQWVVIDQQGVRHQFVRDFTVDHDASANAAEQWTSRVPLRGEPTLMTVRFSTATEMVDAMTLEWQQHPTSLPTLAIASRFLHRFHDELARRVDILLSMHPVHEAAGDVPVKRVDRTPVAVPGRLNPMGVS